MDRNFAPARSRTRPRQPKEDYFRIDPVLERVILPDSIRLSVALDGVLTRLTVLGETEADTTVRTIEEPPPHLRPVLLGLYYCNFFGDAAWLREPGGPRPLARSSPTREALARNGFVSAPGQFEELLDCLQATGLAERHAGTLGQLLESCAVARVSARTESGPDEDGRALVALQIRNPDQTVPELPVALNGVDCFVRSGRLARYVPGRSDTGHNRGMRFMRRERRDLKGTYVSISFPLEAPHS